MSPTSLQFNNISEYGARFTWTPKQVDAGKNITLCCTLQSITNNPRNPEFSAATMPNTACIFFTVPLCRYKSRYGDTIQTIARAYKINWRAMYSMNPDIGSPSEIPAGTVRKSVSICLIHSFVQNIFLMLFCTGRYSE